MKTQTLTLSGEEYVVLPKSEYLRLTGEETVDARVFVRGEIARRLRLARAHAKLSQVELAKRLKVTQSMVSHAETGRERVAEGYLGRVLKACGLPKDWVPPATRKARRQP